MRTAIRTLLLPAIAVALALAAPAQAGASPLDVQRDCADSDVLERKHSRADLQATLKQIQADLAEYSDCRRMVLAALAALEEGNGSGGAGGDGGGAGSGDGGAGADGKQTAKERREAQRKQRERERDQIAAIGDDLVEDDEGSSAATASGGGSGGSSLPLILAIVALVGAGAGGGLWYASKRNPAVANALRRVPLPFLRQN